MAEIARNTDRFIQINSVKIGIEVDQCIDMILGDFQVLKYFEINNLKWSKLELVLRNKFVKYGTDDW